MIRQDIRIGDYKNTGTDFSSYKYVIDYYKAGVDIKSVSVKKFVMVRKYTMTDGISYDSDIYIIDRAVFENNTQIIWPITNSSFTGFSNDCRMFNDNYDTSMMTLDSPEVYSLYKMNDQSLEDADIPCDVIRIYHPHNRTELKSVIYMDAIVGTVKVHLFCSVYQDMKTNAEDDFEVDGVKYSEYVECFVPDIEYLMSGSIFYKEDLSVITGKDGITNGLILTPEDGSSPDNYEYASLKLFSIPFIISEKDNRSVKEYAVDINDTVAQDYVAFPIRVTIYPYTDIDSSTSIYINNSTLAANSDVIQDKAFMSLAAKIGWDDNGVPALTCSFNFPGKSNFSSLREAYEHFYHVDLNDYTGIIEYDENDDDDEGVEQKQCGFVMSIYTDYKLSRKLYQEIFEISDPSTELDDFSFQLSNIFSNWDQLTDTMVIVAKFVDKYLGTVIQSNPVVVNEKSYKYFVCDDIHDRNIVKWTNSQKQDMDLSNINFIDKITCTIKRTVANDTRNNVQATGPKVLYKPIFYRVQDLQNIRIRAGVTQKIGVALADYMTKVESFILTIGEQQFVETARNDIYVIFQINGSLIGGTDGTYHISNQDGEYISSGEYTIIR